MIFVGIDVAKDKHDCFILNSEGTVLADVFTIANNRIGFETLLSRIQSCSQGESKIKVGLEATGHYSYNLLGFLLDSGLATYVINPLHTNLYRKSLSLRRTKTDRIDARTIAMMLMSDVDLKSYSNTAYHNEELKSLTRYRFDKVKERAKLKSSVARLVNILFPELEKLVSSLHIAVVYALLSNYPGASYIANANTEELAEILCTASKGRYTKSKTAEIQVAAGVSIGSKMPAKSMELKHTIALIRELDKEISEVESAIDKITSQMDSPIFTIPGIGRHMSAMILAEVGDFPTLQAQTSCWLMLDSLHLHISQGNCKTVMLTWKSVAPDICDMLFSMPPNMFAFGVLHSRPILKRSVLRESITMLPSLMLLKSW